MNLIPRLKLRWLCSIVLIMLSQIMFAADTCDLPLHSGENIFLLRNISSEGFWVDHSIGRPLSAGWSSWLDPQRVSLLALQSKSSGVFQLTVTVVHDTHYLEVNCARYLWIQKVPMLFSVWSFQNSGWVSENKPLVVLWYYLVKT